MRNQVNNNATEAIPNSASTTRAYVNCNSSFLGLWDEYASSYNTHQETSEQDVSTANWKKKVVIRGKGVC